MADRLALFSALDLEGDDLPREFLIFRAGVNRATKGEALFDEQAARAVMAAADAWGLDRYMIDLNHDAMEASATSREDAGDARGWFELDLREDGSLWAVNVTWTPDGERRLREKTQRYISPFFTFDPEDSNRVTGLVNVALVAAPAMHDAPALMAASALQSLIDPEDVPVQLRAARFTAQARRARGG